MYSTVCALEFTQSYTEPYRVTCLLHMMATRHYIVYDMNTVVFGICVERNVCFIFSLVNLSRGCPMTTFRGSII